MVVQFNVKQRLAIKLISEFIDQKKDRFFYLMGYAGTGKTFLVNTVVSDLIRKEKVSHIYICAPTHQALNVIESYLRLNLDLLKELSGANTSNKISFMTVQKLLEYKPIIQTNTGSKVFIAKKKSKFFENADNKLIIIDECSMISKEMYQSICDNMLDGFKIIYMGDINQLPPISESESKVFSSISSKYKFNVLLDEIMRTKSRDIQDVCGVIRDWNLGPNLAKDISAVHKKSNGGIKIYKNTDSHCDAAWFKVFLKKIIRSKTSGASIPIVLAWKNKTCDIYNELIRKAIHKSTNSYDNNFKKGDFALFSNYYLSPLDDVKYYTSNLIRIKKVETKKRLIICWKKSLISDAKSADDKAFNILINKLSNLNNSFNVDLLNVESVRDENDDVVNVTSASKAMSGSLTSTSSEEGCNSSSSSSSSSSSNSSSSFGSDAKYADQQIRAISRSDELAYEESLKVIKEHIEFFHKKINSVILTDRLWDLYHTKMVDPYAPITFSYAITAHKAQGSTFQCVFVDMTDILDNPKKDEARKALYTACGRAAKELNFIV